ncbi:cold-shock protein [Streptomyces sp. TP-A0356]|uniref:cold-shock protein n=1 Tax=Streptomyces sp. TP-A0356 TaxID=1359208 RepID=UPI0006E35D0D|nr:cold shock domain-containing protein [Streptomyces sp. TP-A0356]
MLMTGRVLRFDEVRGYGFIAPSEPGEDVFMHANDLIDEKFLYQEGSEVEFFMEMGEKGPKASQIRLVHQPSGNRLPVRPAAPGGVVTFHYGERAEAAGDAPSRDEFRAALTEALVESVDTLTAAQIKQIRGCVVELARARGWLDS